MDVLYFRAKATSLPRFEYHRNAKKWPAFVCFWKKWLVEISNEMMKCRAARRIFMIDISWSSFRWFNIESISKSQGWDLPIWWLARFSHSTAFATLMACGLQLLAQHLAMHQWDDPDIQQLVSETWGCVRWMPWCPSYLTVENFHTS